MPETNNLRSDEHKRWTLKKCTVSYGWSKEWYAAILSLFGSPAHETFKPSAVILGFWSFSLSLAANYTCVQSEAMNNEAQFLILISSTEQIDRYLHF